MKNKPKMQRWTTKSGRKNSMILSCVQSNESKKWCAHAVKIKLECGLILNSMQALHFDHFNETLVFVFLC